ncbi:unnamed protein product [Cyprideis torosa]|uniref:Uncharacterized protein n=1 Tax=Cyprideis torosa TaxID=163714 RepID=A0A7R8WSC8_9CRUS|nr:unnamed protein product [Cyprideis torosa]CAG0903618.1 unnamed protein product [Cyprideis torosa]
MTARRRRIGPESESDLFARSSGSSIRAGFSSLLGASIGESDEVSFDPPSSSLVADLSIMKGRDRTQEFLSAARSMQGMQLNGMTSIRSSKKSVKNLEALQKYSEVMGIAKMISRNIQNTYTKLEKLTLLCKRKSLFDDKPAEIQELTYIIKQDLASLNKQIAKLQTLVKGSLERQSTTHVQSHSNSVVLSLQSKLASMSNDFKEVLEIRTENLKHERSRREQFSHSGHLATDLPPSATSGFHSGSVLLADEAERRQGGDHVIEMPQHNQLLMEDDHYLESRATAMQSIESTIVELGSIFQQLAYMVKEQEEVIHRIDHNVEDAQLNVEAAHTEILRYFRSVSSNRWLMIKIFGVLIMSSSSDSSANKTKLIERLYEIGVVKFGSFLLKNGITSPVYVDFRVMTSRPDLMVELSQGLWKCLPSDVSVDVVCGVPYGALPVAALMTLHRMLPLVMRRKEVKR